MSGPASSEEDDYHSAEEREDVNTTDLSKDLQETRLTDKGEESSVDPATGGDVKLTKEEMLV